MSTKYAIIKYIWENTMQIVDIVNRIVEKFNIPTEEFVRKPRAGHPGWTNKQFIELITTYGTGPEVVIQENCGEQTFNRAATKLIRPITGPLNGGNETFRNKLLHLVSIKKCPSCTEYLDYSYFGIDSNTPYGTATYCKECTAIRNKYYYDNNKETYHKPYINEHRSEYNARNAFRRSRKISATPSWATLALIKDIYKYCPEGCHVDHKVPLQGDNVCGLHVENNLQYLSIEENLAKGNKLLEEFANSNLT